LAAIATVEAAKLNSLEVLEKHVGDLKTITTRYIIVEREKVKLPEGREIKCSIAVAMRNEPLSLLKVISCFAYRNMNICKVDTRPASTVFKLFGQSNNVANFGEYLFYFDFISTGGPSSIIEVLDNVKQYSLRIREFGCYPEDEAATLQRSPAPENKSQPESLPPWTAYL